MVIYVLSILSVILFCFSARMLIQNIVLPLPVFSQTEFSRQALRLERLYKVIAWSVMCAVLLIGLIMSFLQVYGEL